MSSLRLALKQSLAETAAQQQEAERKRREEEEERRRKDKKRRQRAQQEQQRRRNEERKRRRKMQQLRRQQQESLSGMDVGSGGRSVSSSTLSSSGASSSGSGSSSSSGGSSSSSSGSDSDSDGSSSAGGRPSGRYGGGGGGNGKDETSSDSDDGTSSSEDASVSSSGSSSSSEDEVEMAGVFDSEVSSDDENDDSARRAAKVKKEMAQHHRIGEGNGKAQAQTRKKKKKTSSPDTKGGKSGGSKGSKTSGAGSTGNKGSSSGAQQTTTAPAPEIVAWMKEMSVGKQRRNMAAGLRVKVRFVTKSNRRGKDGKPLRRLKWYGGLVTDVSTSGKKIRIKYDDGTSEVSDFPDKDIVVDDENNKRHKYGLSADAFVPPPPPPSPPPVPEERNSPLAQQSRSQPQSPNETEVNPAKTDYGDEKPNLCKAGTPPSPDRPKIENGELRTPTVLRAAASEDTDSGAFPSLETQGLLQPTPVRAKPSIVSESPFSPAPNVCMMSSVSSRSIGSDCSGSSDADGKCKQSKTSKRSRSPIPLTIDRKDQSWPETEEKDKERRSSGSVKPDKPSKTLHIKLIPPKLSKSSSNDEHDKTKAKVELVRPARKAEVDTGYLPSDGEDTKADDRGDSSIKAASSQDMEFEWKDDPGGAGNGIEEANLNDKKLSGKKRSSPVHSESLEEQRPRKKSVHTSDVSQVVADPTEEADRTVDDASGEKVSDSNPVKALSLESTVSKNSSETSAQKILSSSDERGIETTRNETKDSDNRPHSSNDSLRIKLSCEMLRGEMAPDCAMARKSPHSLTGVTKSKKKRFREERERSRSPARRDIGTLQSPIKKGEEVVSDDYLVTRRDSNSSRSVASLPQPDEKEPSAVELDGQQLGSDKRISSSFVPVEEMVVENKGVVRTEGRSTTKITIPVPRSGRRAAQKANERIKERKEIVINESPERQMKKKKEKPDLKLFDSVDSLEEDEGGSDDEGEEDRWVQCDRCEKWRLLPRTVEMDKLPERWYCELNVYDPRRNSCDAPEQTAREIEVEKRGKKAQRVQSVASTILAASPHVTEEETATSSLNEIESSKRASPRLRLDYEMSDVPVEEQIVVVSGPDPETGESGAKGKDLQVILKEIDECDEHEMVGDAREAKSSSGALKKAKSSGDDALSAAASDTASEYASRKSEKERRRERKRERDRERRKNGRVRDRERDRDCAREKPSRGGKEKCEGDSQEWVQCEKCEKWRRLPPRISAEDLPEIWYCSMNTWDANTASCDVEEDKMDSSQKEFTIFGNANNAIGSSFGSGGKLSYRNLIFGTGRKQHRPVSERTRAAESLFSVQPTDSSGEEIGPPTVKYTNSSAFVCRGMSSHKPGADDSERVSFLDIMAKSQLWVELTQAAHAMQALSCGIAGFPNVRPGSNGINDEAISRSMKGLVQKALGNKTLACHEVLLEAQCRQWDDRNWSELRPTCTLDSVTQALNELVRDGVLETVSPGCVDRAGIDVICYRKAAETGEKAAKANGRSKHAKTSRCGKKKWLDRARSNVESQRV